MNKYYEFFESYRLKELRNGTAAKIAKEYLKQQHGGSYSNYNNIANQITTLMQSPKYKGQENKKELVTGLAEQLWKEANSVQSQPSTTSTNVSPVDTKTPTTAPQNGEQPSSGEKDTSKNIFTDKKIPITTKVDGTTVKNTITPYEYFMQNFTKNTGVKINDETYKEIYTYFFGDKGTENQKPIITVGDEQKQLNALKSTVLNILNKSNESVSDNLNSISTADLKALINKKGAIYQAIEETIKDFNNDVSTFKITNIKYQKSSNLSDSSSKSTQNTKG